MSNCCPVSDGNTVYPSQVAAAAALGTIPKMIRYHLDAHGDLSKLGSGQSRPNCQNAAKPIDLFGVSFPSRVSAAAALGLTVNSLVRRMSPAAKPAMRDDLMRRAMTYRFGRMEAVA